MDIFSKYCFESSTRSMKLLYIFREIYLRNERKVYRIRLGRQYHLMAITFAHTACMLNAIAAYGQEAGREENQGVYPRRPH